MFIACPSLLAISLTNRPGDAMAYDLSTPEIVATSARAVVLSMPCGHTFVEWLCLGEEIPGDLRIAS